MELRNKIKLNLKAIISLSKEFLTSFLSILASILVFFSWEDLGIENKIWRFVIAIFIILLSIFIASIMILTILKSKLLWNYGKNTVTAMYGDIFKIGFKIKEKKKKIVVIPVNDTFDMIVEEPGEKIRKPLVSPNSNHGKWIKMFCERENISQEELNNRVLENLEFQNISPEKIYSINEREKGNLKKYKLGTISVIDSKNNTTFYLIAISSFDENNNAQSNKYYIKRSLETLLEYYDKNGQSDDIYIPLMGTGTSRAKLSHKESYRLIKSICLSENINGKINIVIYDGDEDKVSIFE